MLKISLLHAPDHSILTSKIEKNLPILPPLPRIILSLFHSVPPPPNALTHGTPLPLTIIMDSILTSRYHNTWRLILTVEINHCLIVAFLMKLSGLF